jgi:putative membrane protein
MMYDMAPMGPIWWVSGLVVVLLVATVVAALAHVQPPHRRPVAPTEDAPVELLRHRLAAGEIDDEEYLRRRSALGD